MNKIDWVVCVNDIFYRAFHGTSIWSRARNDVFLNPDVMWILPVRNTVYLGIQNAKKHNHRNS